MKKFLIVFFTLVVAGGLFGLAYLQFRVMTTKSDQPSITLLSPNGGEVITEGQVYTIKWATQNVPSTYKISITIRRVPPPPLPTEGQEFDPIVFTNLDNNGSTTWTVSNMYPEGNYILGITAYASTPINNPISNESDSVFRIVKNTVWQTYANDRFGYSIDYPSDWIFREFPDTQTGAGFRAQDSPNNIASECINVDERSAAANDYNVPFDEYVKEAAVAEIQGYEKLNSIESVTTTSGLVGYETTWIYKDMQGQQKISLPITYFDNEKTVQGIKYKTVQVTLSATSCQDVYSQMISTFKLLNSNQVGCSTNSDCPSGYSCMVEGPLIAGQPVKKVCTSPGQAVPQ